MASDESVPDNTRLFIWASGFGLGAVVVLLGFVLLVGIGTFGHQTASTPATQPTAATTQPAQPPAATTTGQGGTAAQQASKPAPANQPK